MGNLRDKYTDEEWDELGEEAKRRTEPQITISATVELDRNALAKIFRKEFSKGQLADFELDGFDIDIKDREFNQIIVNFKKA